MPYEKQLSIILPAYLEEENLRLLLPRVKDVASEITSDNYEIIVVDTQEPMDGTPKACKEVGVTYVNRTGGNTYGDAIRSGISAANGEHIIFMDADGSHNPGFIKKLYAERVENDLVIASRYVKGGMTENNWVLVLMSKMVNVGYSIVLNIKCKDVSNSFKLYKASMLKPINLTCNNFDIVEEILYKIIRRNKGMKIKELPFTFKQRLFGETKRNLPAFIIGYFFTLVKLRLMK